MLKKQIAHMLMMGFTGTTLNVNDPVVKAILSHQIGGVILFSPNIQSPNQLQELIQKLKDFARQAQLSPFFIGVDYEGGTVERLPVQAGFPETLTAQEIGQLPYVKAKQSAEQMADTLKHAGFNLNFAPVIDVNVNLANPIIGKRGRSFSNDPMKVAEYAEIFIKAYRERGIICALKHFPGHGSSKGDTHTGLVDVTEIWQKYEIEPYKQLFNRFNAGLMVMTSHVVHFGLDNVGYPASLSKAITTDLLRDTLNFQGVVVTDDLQMQAITDHYGLDKAVVLALNAGADMLLFGNQLTTLPQDPQTIIHIIENAVRAGSLSESHIKEAYLRILKLGKTFIN